MRTLKLFRGLFIVGVLVFPMNIFGQGACPACSNPMLPPAINDRFYADTIKQGTINVTFYSVDGFNFSGGHLNGGYLGGGGVDTLGNKINVPLHKHEVEMNFYRMELSGSYAFKDNWTVRLHIPYEIKDQFASTPLFDTIKYTQYQIDAIIRQRDLHHPTEVFKGFADMRLLVSHRFFKVFLKKDMLDIAFGTSLPTGRTEPNALKLVAESKKHNHIQFGTGTFDPLLELNYSASLIRKFAFNTYALGKISFYENKNGEYKGPAELTGGINIFYFTKRFNFRAGGIALYQGYYYWDGVRDPNSGLISTMLSAGVQTKISNHISLNIGTRYPLYQTTFIKNEEGPYKQGPTVMFEFSHLMNIKQE